MNFEEDIRRLQEAKERTAKAKDYLIETQAEKIELLKKQREALVVEKEKRKQVLGKLRSLT